MTKVKAKAPEHHPWRDFQDPETAEISLIMSELHTAIKNGIRRKKWTRSRAAGELNLRTPVIQDIMNDRIVIKDIELLIRLCLRLGLMVYMGTDLPIFKGEKSRVSLVSRTP
jgi:predicted XRE-type DNA-binding protein